MASEERMAEQPDPLLAEKKALAADLRHAVVREIYLAEARNLIVSQECWGISGVLNTPMVCFLVLILEVPLPLEPTAGRMSGLLSVAQNTQTMYWCSFVAVPNIGVIHTAPAI